MATETFDATAAAATYFIFAFTLFTAVYKIRELLQPDKVSLLLNEQQQTYKELHDFVKKSEKRTKAVLDKINSWRLSDARDLALQQPRGKRNRTKMNKTNSCDLV